MLAPVQAERAEREYCFMQYIRLHTDSSVWLDVKIQGRVLGSGQDPRDPKR